MSALVMVMLGIVPIIIFSFVAGISGLPAKYYNKQAENRALSVYHQTGSIPGSATVIGRTVTVPSGAVKPDRIRAMAADTMKWRKTMVEQALINVCLMAQSKCGNNARNLVWAFMPSSSGTVASLLSGTTSSTLNCATATEPNYAQYERYLLNNAIDSSTVAAVTFEGASLNYYYSKPSIGEGCTYNDLVDLR